MADNQQQQPDGGPHFLPALEEDQAAVIGNCATLPQDVVLLPSEEHDAEYRHHHRYHNGDSDGSSNTNVNNNEQIDTDLSQLVVDVMNTSPESSQAYMRLQEKEPIMLDHHAPGWGMVYFGVIVSRVGEKTYRTPPQKDAKLVAIKRWRRNVIDPAVQRGANENPYREILRSQVLGDNIHVLRSIEAFQDQDYLYMIMPYCPTNLVSWLPWNQGVSEPVSSGIYKNILENIQYCHDRGVCHRDISPDNCLIHENRIVFNDMAMSFRIPPSPLVQPLGLFGKLAYLPPEVVTGAPFSARSSDLWSATVVLFNLLTGEIGWEMPVRPNVIYNYLVLAGGIVNPQLNERLMEQFGMHAMHNPMAGMPRLAPQIGGQDRLAKLQRIAQRVMALSDETKDLLSNILREDFDTHTLTPIRLTPEQAMDSTW
eukprot:CAMPEP_0113467728 /NCGR_PEP_ID=MMETSP0014_2-20120614/14971_1 /TAXON_ID=2857 /ORGANISM="Nitzschia sp." /LENGTH=424 /DNA_ID=CAMNT_0000360059 /DNA_START=1094 /DNA_END=2365 /DNA_ORIENTATION=- /assembly_acc=CAM_ASM_000159